MTVSSNTKRKLTPKELGVRGFFHYDLQDPNYQPQRFINRLMEICGVSTNEKLAAIFGVSGSMIGHISTRNHHMLPPLMCRISDVTGMSLNQIRQMAGIPLSNERLFFNMPTAQDVLEDAKYDLQTLHDYADRNIHDSGLTERLNNLKQTLERSLDYAPPVDKSA